MPIILSPSSSSIIVPHVNTVSVPLISPVVQVTPVFPYVKINYDSGMNDNWMVQKQANDYLFYRILDYWIHKPVMESVLKYLKVENGKVNVVKSDDEYNKNDVSNDTMENRELKADFIEENILDKDVMKKILIRVMDELNLKWQFLSQPKEEKIVVGVTKRYLKKKLKEMK